MAVVILVFICVFLAVIGQVLMKKGMTEVGKIKVSEFFGKFFKIFLNPYVILACLLYASTLIFWLVALSQLDLSYMYPLISVGYILVALASFIFLKENITLMRWLGIILIAGGSFVITRS